MVNLRFGTQPARGTTCCCPTQTITFVGWAPLHFLLSFSRGLVKSAVFSRPRLLFWGEFAYGRCSCLPTPCLHVPPFARGCVGWNVSVEWLGCCLGLQRAPVRCFWRSFSFPLPPLPLIPFSVPTGCEPHWRAKRASPLSIHLALAHALLCIIGCTGLTHGAVGTLSDSNAGGWGRDRAAGSRPPQPSHVPGLHAPAVRRTAERP